MFFLTVYSDIFCSAFVHVSVLLCLLVLVLPFCSPFCCICVVFLIILIDMSNNCIVYCLLCVPAIFLGSFCHIVVVFIVVVIFALYFACKISCALLPVSPVSLAPPFACRC